MYAVASNCTSIGSRHDGNWWQICCFELLQMTTLSLFLKVIEKPRQVSTLCWEHSMTCWCCASLLSLRHSAWSRDTRLFLDFQQMLYWERLQGNANYSFLIQVRALHQRFTAMKSLPIPCVHWAVFEAIATATLHPVLLRCKIPSHVTLESRWSSG